MYSLDSILIVTNMARAYINREHLSALTNDYEGLATHCIAIVRSNVASTVTLFVRLL